MDIGIKSENTVFLFPGQGSQAVGMGRELAQANPIAREVFEQANDLLGFNLAKIAWEGPEEELNDTINTQPALLVHSVAALQVFKEKYPDFRPAYVAGHSMGEISSLVAAQALPFGAALLLARRRGELMKQAGEQSPGGMAAILGLDIPTLEQVCVESSRPDEIVQVANDNSPGQVVISGASPALDRAVELARQAGARRAVRLAVSIAAHSPLMAHSQMEFNRAVEAAPIRNPQIPIIGNISASPLLTAEDIRSDLEAQLTSRVRWTETVRLFVNSGITTFLEMGSGSVLTGLLKRIDRQAHGIPLATPADFTRLEAI